VRAAFPGWLALAAWAATCTGAARADSPATLRVDYFHTGGQGVEIFALDRVIDLYAGPRQTD
jgi:hypothetical protein